MNTRRIALGLALAVLMSLLHPSAPPLLAQTIEPTATGITTRVSVSSAGVQSNGGSKYSHVSANGQYVVFMSQAINLVSGDTNGVDDIFVRDQQSGQTTRVSVSSTGAQSNAKSTFSSISADGRFVAFDSDATNLVSGDTNGVRDVFVRDRLTYQTTRVSVSSAGIQGDGESSYPSISADGRYVAFTSWATNLASGDTNSTTDVFVRDRLTNQTTRVSVTSNGAQANSSSGTPSISADGRFVAFGSGATNLVSGDTNGSWDVFVRDRITNQTTRVSVASNGVQANSNSGSPSISADGRFVAFGSGATNLVSGDTNGSWDVFVRDRLTNQTTRVSVSSNGTQGNDYSGSPSISGDGRFVAFESRAINLVSMDMNGNWWDVFVRDRQTGQTTLVSVSSSGGQGFQNSDTASLSADGRYVAFRSDAQLVSEDTKLISDIFLRTQSTTPAPHSLTMLASSLNPSVAGQWVTFTATVAAVLPATGIPTGTVVFKDGAAVLGSINLVSGKAIFATRTLAPGTHSITAVYSGNTTFWASASAPLSQVVTRAASKTVLASSPNPSSPGQTVTLTATVSAVAPGSGLATGQVTFKHELASLGTVAVVGGKAVITTSGLALGSHTFTAVYSGDTKFTGSTSPSLTHAVKAPSTAKVTSASPNPSVQGGTVLFTAVVTATSGTPTGTVVFKDEAASLGSSALTAGKATLRYALLPAGLHAITAQYSGDATFGPSVSPVVSHTVILPPVVVIENEDLRIQYDGWKGYSNTAANGGTYRTSNRAGDTAAFRFTGTAITWVTQRGPDQGQAQILVDGALKGTVDLYSPTVQMNYSRAISGLTAVAHTLTIKVLGTKNASATAAHVAVDAFTVGTTTTQDNSPSIAYGKWGGGLGGLASGGAYRFSGTAGSSAALRFIGTSIEWITLKGPSYGNASVFIDGVNKGTFDLYQPALQWQAAIPFTGLSVGIHTIEVRPLGTKNPSSTGVPVLVDAFRGPMTPLTSPLEGEAEESTNP